MPDDPDTARRRALVVFSGQADLAWLTILKPGYRHCFAVLESGPRDDQGRAPWIIYNPLSHATEIDLLPRCPLATIADHYRAMGLTVAEMNRIQVASRHPVPWRPYTCVEAVKRALGLRAPWVLTPWQLWKFVELDRKKKIILDNRN